MRAAVGFALAALLPAVVAQPVEDKTGNDRKNLVTRSSISRLDPELANIDDDENDLLGAEVIFTFAEDGDYENPKDGHLVMPYTGRRYTLSPDWDLRTIEVDAGPCTMFYSNTSDAEGNEWDKTDKIKFGKKGGNFNFQDAEGTQRMKYLYCGVKDQGEKLLPETRCNKIVGGGSAVEKGHVCCRPPTEWRDELWALYEMDDYTGKALDHFNEEGWPTNVMATFSTYDLTAYKPVTDMKKELPYWEWNCGGINSNMCFSKDLSDWEACRADPRRRMLLQSMENFSSVIQTAQTQFNQDALTKIVMTLPNLTKTLFPLEGENAKDEFDAPGDYQDSSWIMIAASIAGLIGIPLGAAKPGAMPKMPNLPGHIGIALNVISSIMFLVGLGLGPATAEPFVEDDPHFTKFGEFSEEVGNSFVEWMYKGYNAVYDTYFHTPSGENPPENTDKDNLLGIMSEGKFIRPWSSPPDEPDDEMQGSMANRFLSPIVNLAYLRNKVFLVKVPAGGLEFWKHKEDDYTNTKRESAIWDPCGERMPGGYGIRTSFVTSERKPPHDKEWFEYGAEKRAVCYEDGSGYAFFKWHRDADEAFTDFGWNEMENRGLKMEDVVEKSLQHQEKHGWFGNPDNLGDRLSEMDEGLDQLLDKNSAIDFWNLAVCDMTQFNDEGPGLVRVEGCSMDYFKEPYWRFVAAYSCINVGIRDRCAKHIRDKNDKEFPYQLHM